MRIRGERICWELLRGSGRRGRGDEGELACIIHMPLYTRNEGPAGERKRESEDTG